MSDNSANIFGEWDFEAEANGLGFLPAVAAGPAIWPAIASIGGAIGGFFARAFGFGDDQKTDYRPPVNASEQFVQFDDKLGRESVAYDLSQPSLAEAARRGNRWEDIYSYYSAFSTGSTRAGASSAARRVIEDAARVNGVSIARAADMILNTAGVRRIVAPFLPSGQGGGGNSPNQGPQNLPGYCPPGTYHPYPIGHPQQDLCIPFEQAAQQQPQQRPRSTQPTGQQPQQPRRRPGVPRFNPQTGQWEDDAGNPYDPATASAASGGKFPWWILLIIAGAYVISDSGDDRPQYYRGRR